MIALRKVCAVIVLGGAGAAYAQSPADSVNERTQLEFCATYIPCGIAVGLMDGTISMTERIRRLKSFFASFGRRPAASHAEFVEFVAAQTPAWRREKAGACVAHRGESGRDFCEESFLLPAELNAVREARVPPKPVMDLIRARTQRADILNRDSSLATGIGLNCADSLVDSAYCEQVIYDFGALKRRADELNADPEFLKFQPPIHLRSEAIASQTHEYDGTRWVRKKSMMQAHEASIAACDALRRELFAAIDAERWAVARPLADELAARCSKVAQLYADLAATAKSRIPAAPPEPGEAVAKPPNASPGPDSSTTPLRRRSTGGTDTAVTDALAGASRTGFEANRAADEEERQRRAESQRLFALDAAERRQREEQAGIERRRREELERTIAASPAPRGGAGGGAGGATVCRRNLDKVHDAIIAAQARRDPFSGSAFGQRVMQLRLQILEPCVNADAEARREYDDYRKRLNEDVASCGKGGIYVRMCAEWGSDPALNQRWLSIFEAEARKAIADPMSYAGLAGQSIQSVQSGRALPSEGPGGSCQQQYDNLKTRISEVQSRAPRQATNMDQLQFALWMSSESGRLADGACKGHRLEADLATAKAQYPSILRTCHGVASAASFCTPRIPW